MEEIFWGALDHHFWGGRCVGAFDLLNISEGVSKTIGSFLRGKENLGNFWRDARVGTFDLWFLRGKFWLTSSIGGCGYKMEWSFVAIDFKDTQEYMGGPYRGFRAKNNRVNHMGFW